MARSRMMSFTSTLPGSLSGVVPRCMQLTFY
jgi:hypothetical protein